ARPRLRAGPRPDGALRRPPIRTHRPARTPGPRLTGPRCPRPTGTLCPCPAGGPSADPLPPGGALSPGRPVDPALIPRAARRPDPGDLSVRPHWDDSDGRVVPVPGTSHPVISSDIKKAPDRSLGPGPSGISVRRDASPRRGIPRRDHF